MKKEKLVRNIYITIFLLFILSSFFVDMPVGAKVSTNFMTMLTDMIKVVPLAFILIGLFEVWVKNETIEKHLGEQSCFYRGHLLMMLLAGTSVGGLYVAFPIAYALQKKGARMSLLFSYLGFAAVCRIPMTIFEASFMGLKFTIVRYLVSIPLIVLSAELFAKYLKKSNFQLQEGLKPKKTKA